MKNNLDVLELILINNIEDLNTLNDNYLSKLRDYIQKKIDNSESIYPGSDTLEKILSNRSYITISSVKYLYNCLKFYEDNNVTDGKEYNDIYNAILYYERRLLK